MGEHPAGQGSGRIGTVPVIGAPARPTASPAARRLAHARGVALDTIRGTGPRGEITRADVEAARVRVTATGGPGQLDPAFLNVLRRDPTAFRALSSDMKLHLYRRLWNILNGEDDRPDFTRMPATDRQAIREILTETKSNLPVYWRL